MQLAPVYEGLKGFVLGTRANFYFVGPTSIVLAIMWWSKGLGSCDSQSSSAVP